jgi:hypothetical protein
MTPSVALRLLVGLAILGSGLLSSAGVTAGAAAANAPVVRDPRFGLNEAWRAPDAADRAGAHWSRILFWWSELQKGGSDELNLFATDNDAYIDGERGRGRELVGAVLNTPGWASSDGSPNGVPKNLFLPWNHAENHWGQFMRRLAEHYRGRIDAWIIWNEVDINHGQWKTWNGSVEEYVQLQKVAYRAIKAGNPKATVLPFGAAWWYDRGDYLARMLDVIAADPDARSSNHYFDVANLHLYSRANDIPNVISWYREQLGSRGMSKPIWVVESNAIPHDDPIWQAPKANFRATMDEQSSYVVQSIATHLGMGVQRIGINRTVDGTDFEAGGEPFGLLRNDGSARPAFKAYQVVTRYFAGTREGTYHPTDGSGLTRVVLKKDGERVTIVWNARPSPISASIEATARRALRVTKYGETSTIAAAGGRYQLDLDPATANGNEHDRSDFVIGGNPIILVERTDDNVDAAYRALEVAPRPK